MAERDHILAASLLAADYGRLAEQGRRSVEAGARWLHIDVMDGSFVPNFALGNGVVRALRPVADETGATLDTHLMIRQPERHLELFADAGTDMLTIHQEACLHLHQTVRRISELGMQVGVALNPATSLSTIDEVLPELDMVLVMTVNPGFGGQVFIDSMLDKVRRLRQTIDERSLSTIVQVDGGIRVSNVAAAFDAGVDVAVAGSAVFGEDRIEENVAALLNAGSPEGMSI